MIHAFNSDLEADLLLEDYVRTVEEGRVCCSSPARTRFGSAPTGACFVRIPAYPEAQLRHPASWVLQERKYKDESSKYLE